MLRDNSKEEKMESQKYRSQSQDKSASVLENIKYKKTLIENRMEELPVARIDYLSSGGKVFCSLDFVTEEAFLLTLKEDLHCGVPLAVVLYRDADGKTISRKFLEELDTLPKGLKEENIVKEQKPKRCSAKNNER